MDRGIFGYTQLREEQYCNYVKVAMPVPSSPIVQRLEQNCYTRERRLREGNSQAIWGKGQAGKDCDDNKSDRLMEGDQGHRGILKGSEIITSGKGSKARIIEPPSGCSNHDIYVRT